MCILTEIFVNVDICGLLRLPEDIRITVKFKGQAMKSHREGGLALW